MRSVHKKFVSITVNKSAAGFSLVELLIAMVIFLIVTAAIYGLMEVGRIDRNRSSRRSDVLKNARVAIHLIGRDALNAGLGYHKRGAVAPDNFLSSTFGLPADPDTDRDMITSVVAGDNLFPNNLSLDTTVRTDLVAFAFRDLDFNQPSPVLPGTIPIGQVIELTDVTNPGGTPSTPRLISKTGGGAAAAQQYDLYLIESDTSQVAIVATAVNGSNQIDAAIGDPLGLNQPLNGVGSGGSVLRKCGPPTGAPPVPDQNCTTYLASVKRFFLVSYKVKADGTLVRTVYGNNRGAADTAQIVEQPLAYNVENLQIDYVLEDGTVTANPIAGPDGILGTTDDDQSRINQVRQLTITIKVQSTEADEQTQLPETITLKANFSTRNTDYDAG